MATRIYKMTGSGNDFVCLDGREHTLADWPAHRIRQVCDRRRGVGADGIVLLSPTDERSTVRMVYYNADGSHAEMCGNAALCSTRLAVLLGMADPDRIRLLTDAGMLESRAAGSGWAAELRFPVAEIPVAIDVPLEAGERHAFQGTVGVPHTILVVDDIAAADVAGRGRALRMAPRFRPAGSNINFVGATGLVDVPWALRTYERGVEAETLACGTGTIAAALALAAAGMAELPVRIRSGSGSVYSVSGQLQGGHATDVWLHGEGRLVMTGDLVDGQPA